MQTGKEIRLPEFILRGKCAVIGFGISNIPLVKLLAEAGGSVTVRDRKSLSELGEYAGSLSAAGVRFLTGDEYLQDFEEDVIFRSPGVRPDAGELPEAVARGARLISEMELFFDLTPATILGITGSDGKTTTTTLTHLFLQKTAERRGMGRVYVGGNIGQPLLPLVGEMTAEDFAVVELSSFQLMTMKQSPARGAITNLSPNHLNWHRDMEEYKEAKCQIFRHMKPGGELVLNAENETDRRIAREGIPEGVKLTWFSSLAQRAEEAIPCPGNGTRAIYCREGSIFFWDGDRETEVLRVSDIRLPGRHNLENYLTAIALTWGMVPFDVIREVAREFGGVAHRLEYVRTLRGVKYYNSSIDSSPSRSCAALSALQENPVVICGGQDKHVPFDPLAEALCRRAAGVILTGEAADQIRQALERCPVYVPSELPVHMVPDFSAAVEKARETAEELGSGAVLLSPACTSFDAFRNFEERGNRFKNLVNSMK